MEGAVGGWGGVGDPQEVGQPLFVYLVYMAQYYAE